jgi:flagellar biosynthesis/type III secretory pathway M-ring protein FliF/YscJ
MPAAGRSLSEHLTGSAGEINFSPAEFGPSNIRLGGKLNSALVVAIVAGVLGLLGPIFTAVFALIVARRAREAEEKSNREAENREQAIEMAKLQGEALKEERAENERLRTELRRLRSELRRRDGEK